MHGQRIGLEPAANLEAVHARHHHVEQDDVAAALARDLNGLDAVRRRDDVEIFGGETRLEQFYVGENVVHHEHARGHWSWPPRPLLRKLSTVARNFVTEMGLER